MRAPGPPAERPEPAIAVASMDQANDEFHDVRIEGSPYKQTEDGENDDGEKAVSHGLVLRGRWLHGLPS